MNSIALYINDPVFNEIHRLWILYHLNDMSPACEHQRVLGWNNIANKDVSLFHWQLDKESLKKKRSAKKAAISALKAGKYIRADERTNIFCES